MARIRYHHAEEDSSSHSVLFLAVGAIAGLAAGVFIAQRFGGLAGLTSKLRERFADPEATGGPIAGGDVYDEEDELEEDDFEEDDFEEEGEEGERAEGVDDKLEERVLEAYRNDPILSGRAVDIGAIGAGIIELTGWVHDDSEAAHAVTLARGVPGIETVVNRLTIRGREEQYAEAARRVAEGDDSHTEAHWEGQHVGIGRRRQGTSREFDRHADPKPELESRWLSEEAAIRDAADDIEEITAERRTKAAKGRGDRTGGAPISPTGVPKSDHVAEPTGAEAKQILKEQTGRETRAD